MSARAASESAFLSLQAGPLQPGVDEPPPEPGLLVFLLDSFPEERPGELKVMLDSIFTEVLPISFPGPPDSPQLGGSQV